MIKINKEDYTIIDFPVPESEVDFFNKGNQQLLEVVEAFAAKCPGVRKEQAADAINFHFFCVRDSMVKGELKTAYFFKLGAIKSARSKVQRYIYSQAERMLKGLKPRQEALAIKDNLLYYVLNFKRTRKKVYENQYNFLYRRYPKVKDLFLVFFGKPYEEEYKRASKLEAESNE